MMSKIELSKFNNARNIIFNTIVIFIVVNIVFGYLDKNVEHFGLYFPWNLPTRYFPSYDLRGYPQIFPWNWTFPKYYSNLLYWSPFTYEADGKYVVDPVYKYKIKHKKRRIISRA